MSKITSVVRDRLAVGSLVLVVLAADCDTAINQVRVETGTVPRTPVFVLTDTSGHGPPSTIYGLSVVPCGSETPVWQLVASGSNSTPSRLTYGETPPGYVVRLGPEPLRGGCYDVFVTDGRRVRFLVDASGHVSSTARRDSVKR